MSILITIGIICSVFSLYFPDKETTLEWTNTFIDKNDIKGNLHSINYLDTQERPNSNNTFTMQSKSNSNNNVIALTIIIPVIIIIVWPQVQSIKIGGGNIEIQKITLTEETNTLTLDWFDVESTFKTI